MANGTAPEEFVVLSRVRTGLKREFAFALKVQSEICGSLGRTRSRKSHNAIEESTNSKRLKGLVTMEANGGDEDDEEDEEDEESSEAAQLTSVEVREVEKVKVMEDMADSMSEEEAKSDIVDLVSDEEPKSHVDESTGDTGTKDEASNAICMEELKEELLDSEDPSSHETVDLARDRELVDVKVELSLEKESEETLKKESEWILTSGDLGEEGRNVPSEDAVDGSASVTVDDGKLKKKTKVLQPRKRFTRSALKPNLEPTMISAEILTKSGSCTTMPVIKNDVDTKPEDVPDPFATPPTKLKMAKLKKMSAKKFPAKLKDLLDTGILEGLQVRYIRGSKVLIHFAVAFLKKKKSILLSYTCFL